MTLKLHLTPNASEAAEKLHSLYIADGDIKWHGHSGNSLEVSYKCKHALTICYPALLVFVPEGWKLMLTQSCTGMSIAALFTIVSNWRLSKCPSTSEWVNKLWIIQTFKYYAAIKRNTTMKTALNTHPKNLLALKGIMLHESTSHKRLRAVWLHIFLEITKFSNMNLHMR